MERCRTIHITRFCILPETGNVPASASRDETLCHDQRFGRCDARLRSAVTSAQIRKLVHHRRSGHAYGSKKTKLAATSASVTPTNSTDDDA